MKNLIMISCILVSQSLYAQISLRECIKSGLANRNEIKTARAEAAIARLKQGEYESKYLPQISVVYEYRYNPIIATQVVPVGQFNAIPNDASRPVQFGTRWQQNAGVTMYQPIIDFAVRSRIREGQLDVSLSQIEQRKIEADLMFEIVKSYSRILIANQEVEEAGADTLRSYWSYSIISAKFNEGKMAKVELNNALINHNANLVDYSRMRAELIAEKIYLHYLTNIGLDRLLEDSFAPIPDWLCTLEQDYKTVPAESVEAYQILSVKESLIRQQIKTERAKYVPTIGLQGFLGANQFTQTFDPVLSNSWFGNSYIGLALKLPVWSPDKSVNSGKQLIQQLQKVISEKEELVSDKNKALLQVNANISNLKEELRLTQHSLDLFKENVVLYQERLQNGQLSAMELNVQEARLQQVTSQLRQLKDQLNIAQVERLHTVGALSVKLKKYDY